MTVFVRKIVLLPGMNLLIILFLFLTSSDPGTQSSSLLSLVLSLSTMVVSVLRFFTGVLRLREGRPAGTAGTGRPKERKYKYSSLCIDALSSTFIGNRGRERIWGLDPLVFNSNKKKGFDSKVIHHGSNVRYFLFRFYCFLKHIVNIPKQTLIFWPWTLFRNIISTE